MTEGKDVGDSPILGAGLYVDGDIGAAGSTGRGEANLLSLASFVIVEQMRAGKSPKDAGMEAIRRIKAQTIEKRLLNDRGEPNFGITFYCVNVKGEHAGVTLRQNFLISAPQDFSRLWIAAVTFCRIAAVPSVWACAAPDKVTASIKAPTFAKQ
jgi:hypothetical protein